MNQIKQFFEIPQAPHNWFWSVILFPFLVTRAIWILVAYFAYNNYLPNPSYLSYFKRGYFLTRIFPLDIFTRWDSKWYLSIIKTGYQASANFTTTYSNLAFFPLYPYLVKCVGWLGVQLPDSLYIFIGLLLSNLFFLASAALLYRLIISSLDFDEDIARRALTLLIVFPVSFFFSAFYPESLFLLLTLLGFTFAVEENWAWTGNLRGFAHRDEANRNCSCVCSGVVVYGKERMEVSKHSSIHIMVSARAHCLVTALL